MLFLTAKQSTKTEVKYPKWSIPILNCIHAAALAKKEMNIPNTLKRLTIIGNISESEHEYKIKL